MGKTAFLTQLNLTEKDFLEVYNELGTVEDVAELFDIHPRTVMNKLRVLKVPFVHRKKEKKYYSSFLKWVMKHPDVVLPRKVSEIATITGLSRDVIYGYMNHRRRKIFSFVTNEFPSFLQRVKFFPLKSGGKMPIKAIESLAFKVDRFTMNIYVTANLKQGTSRTFIATPGQFERYIGKEINL